MNYLSLFSGIEAASVAWHDFDWNCVGVSEIDKFACEVLKQRFPTVPNLGSVVDITKEQLDEIKEKNGAIDIVVGGSPCQSFSVAGKRLGLNDARGNLMFEYCRIVGIVRPKWFIWENVPGALSSGKGEDFACLLEEMAQFGYSLAWRVLDAQYFGVPQRRRRVFLIGCLGDDKGPFKVLFERESSGWDTTQSRETEQNDTTQVEDSIGEYDQVKILNCQPLDMMTLPRFSANGRGYGDVDSPQYTLTTSCTPGVFYQIEHDLDSSSVKQEETVIYTASAIRTGSSIEHSVCPTLRASHSKMGDNFPSIVVEHDLDSSIVTPLYARSLSSSSSDDFAIDLQPKMVIEQITILGSGQSNAVMGETSNIAFNDANGTRKDRPNGGCYISEVTTSNAITCGGVGDTKIVEIPSVKLDLTHDVVGCLLARDYKGIGTQDIPTGKLILESWEYSMDFELGGTLTARDWKGISADDWSVNSQKAVLENHYVQNNQTHHDRIESKVRRLTPLECERLQGFPDNWTQIEWCNKSKEDCPVSPRYKTLGNSMAVPVMRWLGSGIMYAEGVETPPPPWKPFFKKKMMLH